MGNVVKVLKLAIEKILPRVFEAEVKHGAGKGVEKLQEVLDGISAVSPGENGPVGKNPEDIAAEVKNLVDRLVAVLNAIGALDDKPGFDIDFTRLFSAGVRFIDSVKKLAGLFV